jgi:hypothetical protein
MTSAWRDFVRSGHRLCTACERNGHGCLYGVDRLCFDDLARAMRVPLSCPSGHEGGPGVAHGGWVAAVMDELLGQLAAEYAGAIVTANLSIDYRRPVPVDQPLLGRSRWLGQDGRKIHIAGELLLAANQAVLAQATALFITIDGGHHRRHADWIAVQERDAR